MAFRAPQQRPQAPRQHSHQQHDPAPAVTQSQQRKRPLEESQDWILFAPPSQTNTSQTPRTADLSRASYFGSLETGARSDLLESDDHIIRQVTADDDGTELDSLDDGLHAFHADPSPRLDQSGGAILPQHDGLGSFPASFANAEALQDQFWQHERYNPQRRHIHRRLSSVQRRLDALEEGNTTPDLDVQEERRLRVERWRTEQSKAVLEEIEKETRRKYRRQQRDSAKSSSELRLSSSAPGPAASIMTGHETTSTETAEPDKGESESFWQRITRRVIQDLIGLDDNTLSVILGQELPTDLSSTPTPQSPLAEMADSEQATDNTEKTWEDRLLERISRELNILVYQLSELESAFSTYTSRLPPSTTTPPLPRRASTSSRPHPRPLPPALESIFRPTLDRPLPTSGDASLWGIEEEPTTETDPTQQKDYWERDPSLRMLFSYLRRRIRLFSPSTTAPPSSGPLPSAWETNASALGTSPESQRRADLIRRNHPLVSRASSRRESAALASRRHREAVMALHRRNGSSSCASRSASKRSRRSSGTGAERKYWDWGGESAVSSGGVGGAGGGGGWGEV